MIAHRQLTLIKVNEKAEYTVTKDAAGNTLAGAKNYRLILPPHIPASNFWSVIVYDTQTRLMIQTDQSWPSVYSSCKKLVISKDGSVDIWFGSEALPCRENNWVKTIPGKGWYMMLRLYNPLEAWLN